MPYRATIMTTLNYLYIDFNSYFASVEQQTQPHLRGKPIAIVPVESDSTCAIAASIEAKRYGIRTGTKIYEAKRLCPDLQLVLARHELYVAFHHRILAEIDKHIPVEQVCSIDECAARLIGREREEAQARAIAARIKAGLAQHIGEYVRCSIGIGPNRYLAKIGTELQKPDGLVVIHEESLLQCLYPLALQDLTGIGWGMSARLQRNGIHTIQQLWDLSPKHMRKIWGGVQGERFWHLLRGHQLPDPPTQRRTIGHSHVLDPHLRGLTPARVVGRRLVLKAASRLRQQGYYSSALTLSVRLEHGPRLQYETLFPRACDNFALQRAFEDLWQRLCNNTHPSQRAKKISVTLHRLLAEKDIQPELLDTPVSLKTEQRHIHASQAMDTLNRKFGRDTVTLGFLAGQVNRFSGAKIAFTRIPDQEEFWQ